MREYEAGPAAHRAQLGHDGREVVAVGAETVQPDDGRGGGAAVRFMDDGRVLHRPHVAAIGPAVQR